MGNHRMFAKSVVMADAFIDLPMSTRCLYFSLGLLADDEGFIDNPKSIVRQIAASTDDLKLLADKRYIIMFDSGVICIRHWKVNNHIRADRSSPTVFQEERSMLKLLSDNTYDMCQPDDNQMTTTCQPFVVKMPAQDKLSKDKISKSKNIDSIVLPTIEEISAFIKEKSLSVNADKFFNYYSSNDWKDAYGNPISNWKQKVLSWDSHSATGGFAQKHSMGSSASYSQNEYTDEELNALLIDLDHDIEEVM